jgi:predicted nucleic acid-binding protein
MTGVVVIDTNLLVLLVVGSAHTNYIAMHKRLKQSYNVDDFELLGVIIGEFSDIILIPHILAEVSSFATQIDNPARRKVRETLKTLIQTCNEIPIESIHAVRRFEFYQLGLTDATILHLCSMTIAGINPTLLTADSDLANSANSLGYSVIDYKQEYQTA